MKPKEYLRSKGVETSGRGRMPRAHVQMIQDAVNSGIVIEGYPMPSPTTAPDGTTIASEVKRVAPSETGLIDCGPPLRDENALIAKVEGTVIGMRTVCVACGSSLNYCGCENPVVWIDHTRRGVVTFYPRPSNAPRPNRWW